MKELAEKDVEQYLLNNPKFVKEWLSKHGKGVEPCGAKPATSEPASDARTKNIFKTYVEGFKKVRTIRRPNILQMEEKELFMELIRDIASELDVNVLCHKILQNVSTLTKCDRGSLFLSRGTKDNRYLVSKLFDVTRTSTLEESVVAEGTEIKVPFGRGIVGHVAQTKETVNIKEAYDDPRFNKDVDKKTGYRTHSILSMPICNYEGEVIGVAQIINKVTGDHEFTTNDEQVFSQYLTFCGIGITNAQLFEMSVQEFQRNQMLLTLARGIFEEQANLENLVQKIMIEAQDLLKCERCTVFLTDEKQEMKFQDEEAEVKKETQKIETPEKEHQENREIEKEVCFVKGFDLFAKEKGSIHVQSSAEIAKAKNVEIAKFVVRKGTFVNIEDLESDDRFGKGPFVEESGFQTRSILCTPIFNSEKRIIGVTQLINKQNGTPFNENDVNIIEAFSIFCGLGIHNCTMYENACKLMAKQKVALEVLSFHASAQNENIGKFVSSSIPSSKDYHLLEYSFDDFPLSDDDTIKATMRMFMDSGVISEFRVPTNVLVRWICSVKKNYRPVTYHNWRHAFNVTQTMFCMLLVGGIVKLMDRLETFTLLVACLCHDLDHRGTNNAFQTKSDSPLAMLYGTSTMEHHHFDHCIMILNSEGNNIFASLGPEDYRKVIQMLEHAILSTDLALYFKKRGSFKQLIDKGETDFKNTEHKDLLKAMMMTACDVAAICKPWEIQKKIAHLVAGEFFEQGDIEKEKLKQQPIAMMDRNKKDELPKMQVGFIDAICIPVYQMFADLWPGLKPLYDGVLYNRRCWQELADKVEKDYEQAEVTRRQSLKQNGKTDKNDQKSDRSTKNKRPPETSQKSEEKVKATSNFCSVL
ncbi:cGMP-specific 3',5'-cyclic phosphodiesterase-like isoform X2 [Liolophura sinensis]|uniref:cGMP-specific 3',5'-cyclic phosphodiesterase-like isoform X2 n=1 Tax=Liolophura sinensis TaxID=3198878 RepID=UPI0031593E7F